ncbi:MAG TPA: amino acid adenylation domain-containing protein, partial [Thermoanaerobaculia bacterium]|nr:amino acid adenylation domain-containing protein [Thermoanaerobaculia bacterium]
PADRPRPARQSFRGAEIPASIPAETADALRLLARRETASPFMALLAAFQTLLQRSTGQEDLLVGTPAANRGRREVEGLIGLFVNTLVMRGRFGAGETSFRQLLRRVRGTALGAFSHQDLPFERLVEELRVERSLACNPLFQVMFAFNDGASLARELPGLSWAPLLGRGTVSKFDLALNLADSAGALAVVAEYATDLFDASTIERLTGHFRVLLAGVAAAPDAPLSDLPLLSPEERAQLAAWSRAEALEASELPVHRLFERQAERSPEASAVAFGAEMLTYAELNRRAGQLAARLRRLGVGPESRVGLLLERSLDLAVGILGIWKAGGAYVPLDPSLPEARLAWLVEDAFRDLDAPVLVTRKGLEGQAAPLSLGGARVVWLGEESSEAVEPSADSEPGSLAYLIYTSGTTGQPKAVQVEHGNLAHTLRAAQQAFGFVAGDRMPCLAPFSFDIFLLEMFGPLLAGGAVVIHPLRPTLDVPRLVAGLAEVTLLHAVPALMRQVVEELERQGSRPPLRRVFVGGDAVPADLLAAMRQSFPEAQITVLYGPTEAAIIASFHEATGAETGMVLGRPLPGAVMELRDRAGHLVPLGVPGEVWLGGPGVARGYLHQPELTAEKFTAQAGERFYRTGDLGRRLADGTVEFLGRVDQQVKVRGFRVEPGEIEAALLQLAGVRQAAVLARREGGTESRLVACVVPDEPGVDLASSLREGLRRRLPEYMIPAAWVLLEELPLTAHGKVDRRALARIEPEAESGEEYVAPRTPTEEMLAGVWAEVLGVPRVGARDDFFALGGHSLLATRVASRLRDTFGSEVPLRTLFEEPTLAALAGRIDALRAEGGGLRVPPIRPVPRAAGEGADFPLSFSQERFWFFEQLEPGSPLYNLTVALEVSGSPSPPLLAASFDEIARRHETLRTRFLAREGRPFQRALPSRPLPLPVVDLGGLPAPVRDREARRVFGDQERRSFDLARGGLIDVRLIRLEEASWLLLVSLHHIVSDAWSSGVLIRELTELYESFSRGLASPLAELPVQYADFADWQRRWLSGETLAAEVAHWKAALAGAPTLIDLPSDRP